MPDPDCDTERVRHADAVKDTVPLRHKLAVADGDLVVEPVALIVLLCDGLFESVPDADTDTDSDGDGDSDASGDSDAPGDSSA